MSAIVLLVAGLATYLLGYFVYARYLGKRVFKLDSDAEMPSKTMEDGKDYVPTNRYVLFGHHFASIAGAAPIVGPALAVIWGWLPAFLWVVLGAVLMGCVHDMSALVLSVRHKARSIGDLAGEIVGKKAVAAYLIIMFFAAMVWNIRGYIEEQNWILTGIGSVILLSGFMLIVLSCGSYMRAKNELQAERAD